MKKEYLLLIIIILFGLFLRVYQLGEAPLWIDEATSAVAGKEIIEKGVPVFDSGLVYDRAIFYHYNEALFLLFGVNDFNVRFFSVLVGLMTILLPYLIGREYSKKGGLIAALFMCVFYLEVFFSRQARMYQLFQFMFFLSLYLLYKSREKPKLIYFALLAMFICIDSQIAGLVLCPVFVLFIIFYLKPKWLALIAAVPLVQNFITAIGLKSDSSSIFVNYFDSYSKFASSYLYMLVLFIPGVIWSFKRKKLLTSLLIVPSVVLLISVFFLETFALRYAYFFVFVLVLYSSLLLSYMYEKYGKLILISVLILLLVPSNLFYYNYVNVVKPVASNLNDYSAPVTNYKDLSFDGQLVSFFSSDVEWYLRKPSYVIPFSMDGRGDDQISWNTTNGVVDRYSGALIFDYSKDIGSFYLLADSFSVSKLKLEQRTKFDELTSRCSVVYSKVDLKVYEC